MAKIPLIERICNRLSYDYGCWIFRGAMIKGYGTLSGNLAHRAVYEALVGPIPEGMYLDHLCRTPACCNPLHLEPVTHAANLRRGAQKRDHTHCKMGHEYKPDTTGRRDWNGINKRVCLVCNRLWQAKYKAAKKARRQAAERY